MVVLFYIGLVVVIVLSIGVRRGAASLRLLRMLTLLLPSLLPGLLLMLVFSGLVLI